MRIKYCIIFPFIFLCYSLFSQVENVKFTYFPWAQSYYNPAALGEKEKHLNFTGFLRQQSMGIHNPLDINQMTDSEIDNNDDLNKGKIPKEKLDVQEVLLNVDTYIKKIKGAVGVTFLNDVIGNQSNVGFGVGYAAKLRVRRGKLGIGAQFDFLNQTLSRQGANNTGSTGSTGSTSSSGGGLNPIDQGDPTIPNSSGNSESMLDFTMKFGFHYCTPTWYVGVSTGNLFAARISGESTVLKPAPQLFINGGYTWNLETPVPWAIEPALLVRTNFAAWSFNAMAIARYNGILWFGLSYELNGAIAVLMGAVPFYNFPNDYLKGLELGISYGFGTSKFSYLKGGGWGDFELVVRYGFNFYRDKGLSGYGSSRHLYKNQ